MTLAEFYALQASPQAIVVPRGSTHKRLRRLAAAVAASADAESTVTPSSDDVGADKKH